VITLSLLHPSKNIPLQNWSFEDESTIRIGRAPDNQVILYSAVVSRHHVELRRKGLQWEIINLGTNGTYLDGKRIEQVNAQHGTVFRLAQSGPHLQVNLGMAMADSTTATISEERVPPEVDQITSLEQQ